MCGREISLITGFCRNIRNVNTEQYVVYNHKTTEAITPFIVHYVLLQQTTRHLPTKVNLITEDFKVCFYKFNL